MLHSILGSVVSIVIQSVVVSLVIFYDTGF